MLTIDQIKFNNIQYKNNINSNRNVIRNHRANVINFGDSKDSFTPMVATNSSSVNFGEKDTKSVLTRILDRTMKLTKSLIVGNDAKNPNNTQNTVIPIYYRV